MILGVRVQEALFASDAAGASHDAKPRSDQFAPHGKSKNHQSFAPDGWGIQTIKAGRGGRDVPVEPLRFSRLYRDCISATLFQEDTRSGTDRRGIKHKVPCLSP